MRPRTRPQPPFVPFYVFTQLMDRWKRTGIPLSVKVNGLPGGGYAAQNRLYNALRWLRFVDVGVGVPTDRAAAFVATYPDPFAFARLLEECYPGATDDTIAEWLAQHGTGPGTLVPATAFYRACARAAVPQGS